MPWKYVRFVSGLSYSGMILLQLEGQKCSFVMCSSKVWVIVLVRLDIHRMVMLVRLDMIAYHDFDLVEVVSTEVGASLLIFKVLS